MSKRKKATATKSGGDPSKENAIPTSMKKFRQSPEIEGFYRFIYENDLRTEAFEIIEQISEKRIATKKSSKKS